MFGDGRRKKNKDKPKTISMKASGNQEIIFSNSESIRIAIPFFFGLFSNFSEIHVLVGFR